MPRGSLTWSLMKATVTWIVVYNVAALATYGWDHPRINFTFVHLSRLFQKVPTSYCSYNQMRERGALTEEQKSKEEALNSYYAAQGEFVTDLFLLRAEPQFDAASMIKTSRF